jgi:viroplasmin and RNaseH domain-containing protein
MPFYVVFEGRTSGVFDSCTQCFTAVDGLIGKKYERYETYETAVAAWESYCELKGLFPGSFASTRASH